MTPSIDDDIFATLSALADGIIPPDQHDAGAGAVNAGPRLGERVETGTASAIYRDGLRAACEIARRRFSKPVTMLSATELHELIGVLCSELPAFYKQLRLDVAALYLGDPSIWARIGFPGPSTAAGGYPDFDRPQQ